MTTQLLASARSAYVLSYEVVATHPHDHSSFTQGLTFDRNSTLYESVGLYGESDVRTVDLASGAALRRTANAPEVFGEGLALAGDALIQLSWRENKVFEYDAASLALRREVDVDIGVEGWGVATDPGAEEVLYVTDGSATLYHVEPRTYRTLRTFEVVDAALGAPVSGLNELEFVSVGGRSELWANVYPLREGLSSQCVVRLNATTGAVLGWIDLRGLRDEQREAVRASPHEYVLNGIAYDASRDLLLVTGKRWDKAYEIRVKPHNGSAPLGADHVRDACFEGHGTRAYRRQRAAAAAAASAHVLAAAPAAAAPAAAATPAAPAAAVSPRPRRRSALPPARPLAAAPLDVPGFTDTMPIVGPLLKKFTEPPWIYWLGMLLLANAYYGLAPNKGIGPDALAGQLASGWLAAFPFFLVYGMNVVAWEDLVKLISGIKKADTEPDTTEADSKLAAEGRTGF